MQDQKIFDLHTCFNCGGNNLEVNWEEFEEQVSYSNSIPYLEYYVECYGCGVTGKPGPSYDLAVRNWNKDCIGIELKILE